MNATARSTAPERAPTRTPANPANPARQRAGRSTAPPALHVVPTAPWRAPLGPFILVSVAVVVTGLLVLLLLNTLVAQDSFHSNRLEKQSSALREREEILKTELAKLRAPGILANRAKSLGLVPANTPGFVRLRDGRVVGEAKPALAPPPPPTIPDTTLAPPVPEVVKAAAAGSAVSTVPAATKPAATKPAATKPAATKPAATKPAATKPAATKPAATKPAATKPVAKRPAGTRVIKPAPPADATP